MRKIGLLALAGIGVTALQNNYTMVTANIKHLERIPNLNIENWEE